MRLMCSHDCPRVSRLPRLKQPSNNKANLTNRCVVIVTACGLRITRLSSGLSSPRLRSAPNERCSLTIVLVSCVVL